MNRLEYLWREMANRPRRPELAAKEIRLLWARAAGLCSFPECKSNLTRFSRRGTAFHIGENAHIAAYSLKGPRGSGGMSPGQRDSYTNHILLCPTCHTLIDTNRTDFPLRLLRRFKAKHESWVAESLHAHSAHIGPSAQFYRNLLMRIERYLDLEHWPWLVDHLWRDMFPYELFTKGDEIARLHVTTLWPRTRPGLEKAIKAVLVAWLKYSEHFGTFCQPNRSTNFFVRERAYDNALPSVIYEFDVKADKWSVKNRRLLRDYVARLNRMVAVVRADLDPEFRQNRGYFPISTGAWIFTPRVTSEEARARRRRLRSMARGEGKGQRNVRQR